MGGSLLSTALRFQAHVDFRVTSEFGLEEGVGEHLASEKDFEEGVEVLGVEEVSGALLALKIVLALAARRVLEGTESVAVVENEPGEDALDVSGVMRAGSQFEASLVEELVGVLRVLFVETGLAAPPLAPSDGLGGVPVDQERP